MEFKLKQLCFAVSLPFFAFLSIYWLKQRKKSIVDLDKNEDSNYQQQISNEQSTEVKSKIELNNVDKRNNVSNEQRSDEKSTVEDQQNQLIDVVKDEITVKLEKLDQDQPNNLSTDFKSNLNESINLNDQSTKLNNNDNYFKLNQNGNESFADKSIIHLTNNSTSNSVNVSNTSSESIVSTDKLVNVLNRSSESIVSNEKSIDLINNDKNIESVNEAKEVFEAIDQINLTENSSMTNNNESTQFTGNTTNLTFDTAHDSSIDATSDSLIAACDLSVNACDSSVNATINSSIKSISFLNSADCSTKTLCSISDDNKNVNNDEKDEKDKLNLSKQMVDEIKSNEDNSENVLDNVEINLNGEEEVKEDYLNESKITTLQNSTAINYNLNSTMNKSITTDAVKVNSNIEDVNFKDDEHESTISSKTNNISRIDDIVEEEKFLNLTEAEFKNDSKLAVNQVIGDIKANISEENGLEKNELKCENINGESFDTKNIQNNLNKSEEVLIRIFFNCD